MRTWPHAPSRAVKEAGNWVITAATYRKEHVFRDPVDLELLHDTLLDFAEEFGWKLSCWAVFSNHYHLVGLSPDREDAPAELTARVHRVTAIELSRRNRTPGRRVWFRAWASRVTFERSYLERLAYVHFNPVKHGLVEDPAKYPWCSAKWFQATATSSFFETVTSMKTDQVSIIDDF